jgi:RHS repeat-associated protein
MILADLEADGDLFWYLTDHLGSVRDIVNTTGSVVDHIKYASFGHVISESQPSNGDRFKFTARELESALDDYFFRARWYDDDVGRFVTEDPIGFLGGDQNLYRYVENGPTTATDPLGLQDLPPYIDIYISTTGMPAQFDAVRAQAHLRRMLAMAGLEAIRLRVIETQLPSNHPQLPLGYRYDQTSWASNLGWWNLHPLTWVPTTANYAYYLAARQTSGYTHYVQWNTTAPPGGAVAITPNQTVTTVYVNSVRQQIQGAPDWSIPFANMLAHEVFWLGVLDHNDPLGMPPGQTIDNPTIRHRDQLTTITEEIAEEIRDVLDLEDENHN